MERVRDRLGTELSWEGERFEARVRYRLDRVLFGLALATTALGTAALGAWITYSEPSALRMGATNCVMAHLMAALAARVAVERAWRGSIARTLVIEGWAPSVSVDGRELEDVASAELVIGPPGQLRLVAAREAVFVALAPPADVARIATAAARVLGRAARPASARELLGWKLPFRATATFSASAILALAIGATLYAAILLALPSAPELARGLSWIAGPLVVLSPLPYWALVARLARAR